MKALTNILGTEKEFFMLTRDYNLDSLFIVSNALYRSAYNHVERRMAPLSHELADLILLHKHYASHLDSYDMTIDKNLEQENFNMERHLWLMFGSR